MAKVAVMKVAATVSASHAQEVQTAECPAQEESLDFKQRV
jgi:hypothetical protein